MSEAERALVNREDLLIDGNRLAIAARIVVERREVVEADDPFGLVDVRALGLREASESSMCMVMLGLIRLL